jgi:hypothetical protein
MGPASRANSIEKRKINLHRQQIGVEHGGAISPPILSSEKCE